MPGRGGGVEEHEYYNKKDLLPKLNKPDLASQDKQVRDGLGDLNRLPMTYLSEQRYRSFTIPSKVHLFIFLCQKSN